MTQTLDPTTPSTASDDHLTLARSLGPTLAAHAAVHDEDGTFVEESVSALRRSGLLALAVPTELGGLGATVAEVAAVQRELARHCGSTALATAMHQHVTCFTAWRWRRGLPGAEATLRRVAEEGILLVSTGGADLTHPRGEARRVDGGYLVSGRKIFASQSSVGTAMSTMFAVDDPDAGRRVLNMSVPLAAEGVSVLDNWDSLGMRGTASNDVVLEDVFVPDERVLADRPHGVVDPPLQVILSIAIPIISAVYLGVAEAAERAAIEAVTSTPRADDPFVQRQVGLMAHHLRTATWALDGALGAVGDDPAPSVDVLDAVMVAKRTVAEAAVAVCDLAMDVAGGSAFSRGTVIERCYRDVRAVRFHPFTPERSLLHSGRLRLGLPVDVI
ncbi:acyl-CoA dehydrogenase family protein [Actinomarinicola tropica]|uniref:Dibenzothiophene monooxygenase n=1 Tax=Actinomarinicola tropica TaxID=2789776 RepID=A0A5Q2RMX1_9ACTN|nr:acyl-CoA dehydrogenase family protein [Actinomarinicola tropica]QGG95427.1 acyl-CoA dehydrogenase [Actinomarinicola tropica]